MIRRYNVRYDHIIDKSWLGEAPDGEYAAYADVEPIIAERDQLRAELEGEKESRRLWFHEAFVAREERDQLQARVRELEERALANDELCYVRGELRVSRPIPDLGHEDEE